MKKLYEYLMLAMIPILVLSITALNMKVTAAGPIRIGVLFPKYLTQGGGGFGAGHGGMYDGAEMAAKEINDSGGINVGGTPEFIQLDLQDEGAYDPTLIPPNYNTAITLASMLEMETSGCQFIIGGFRTETTQAALFGSAPALQSWNTGGGTPIPFFISGAATGALINNNQTQNPGGQWVFRVTPVNDTQLFYTVANYVKQYLAPKLAAMYTNATYPSATPGQFRYAVIAEDLTWTQTMAYLLTAPAGYPSTPGYSFFLGPYVNTSGVIGTGGSPVIPGRNLVPATGYDFTSLVSTLNSSNVHMIIDIFTMPEVNNLIHAVKAANMPAIVIGIDVPGQQQSHWADTGGSTTVAGDANYECLLCWSGTGTNIVTGVTDVFFKNFCSFSGGYWPMYTASGAYDAIYGIKDAIEAAGTKDTNNPALLAAIQATDRTATTGRFKYASNDVYANSNGILWTPMYGSTTYGWVRSEMVQWIQNTTAPASPYPNVGAQMNTVDPVNGAIYSRRTILPPSMYFLGNWGDIKLNGKVDLADLVTLANAYGTLPGIDPTGLGLHQSNVDADINNDGKVSLADLVTLATHYGQYSGQPGPIVWPLP
jgi:ABC-type branched-subunit amino acid transport system substrate-binding protein